MAQTASKLHHERDNNLVRSQGGAAMNAQQKTI